MTVKFTAVWTIGTSILGAAIAYYLCRNIKQRKKLKPITYTMTIPADIFGEIVGRKGRNLENIEKQTKTTITFKSEEDCLFDERTTYITGIPENVKQAEKLIQDLIKEVSLYITERITFPTSVCSWLEGCENDTINTIRWFSGSKVTMCRGDVNGLSSVTIRGTPENNLLAKTIITEKLEDAKHFFSMAPGGDAQPPVERPPHSRLYAESKDGFVQAYVSLALTPGHFWIQPVPLMTDVYDIMDNEMKEFYDIPENREEYKVTDELKVGDMVAMTVEHEGKDDWYRAEVIGIREPMEGIETEKRFGLISVEFGFTRERTCSEVFILKDEWMILHRQAIECCLANVKPKEGGWLAGNLAVFERLTYATLLGDERLTVMVRPVCYGLPLPGSNSRRLVPFVELVDANVVPKINIASELVALGEALWDLPPSSP